MQPIAPGRDSTTYFAAAINAGFLTVVPLLVSPARVSSLDLGTIEIALP